MTAAGRGIPIPADEFRAVLRGAARILLAEGAESRINVKF